MQTLTQPAAPGDLVALNPNLFASSEIPHEHGIPEPRIYCIKWQRVEGGPGRGKGTKRFTKTDAEGLCAELNRDYKHIHHSVALA